MIEITKNYPTSIIKLQVLPSDIQASHKGCSQVASWPYYPRDLRQHNKDEIISSGMSKETSYQM